MIWIILFHKWDKSHDSCSFYCSCEFLLVFEWYSWVISWYYFPKFCNIFEKKFYIFVVDVLSIKRTGFIVSHDYLIYYCKSVLFKTCHHQDLFLDLIQSLQNQIFYWGILYFQQLFQFYTFFHHRLYR